MISIEEKEDFLLVKASGKLEPEDYKAFAPEFERVIKRRPDTPMLLDASELQGWSIEGLWSELKFDVRHKDDFGAMAVVGEEGTWQEWGTKLSRQFFSPPIRFFPNEKCDEAVAWLKKQRELAESI